MPFDALYPRVFGGLIGQAVGDALGAPTEGMSVETIRQTYGWITGFVSDDPVGTDDTEYAMLTARIILEYRSTLTPEIMSQEWMRYLAGQSGGFYGGGFSEMGAIYNLRKGIVAPWSGRYNHEMWSDGCAMRIAPVGIYCAGRPEEAVRLAAIEGSVSHSGDGIVAAQALAASVSVAMVASNWEDIVEAGLRHIPADSWSARKIDEAVRLALGATTIQDAVDQLAHRIPILEYPWADVAPEAVALAYGVFVAARGEYVSAVLAGANLGRDADTIAAMAGALAGTFRGANSVPDAWKDRIQIIRGHCIRATAGMDVRVVARELAEAILAEEERDNFA